MRESYIEFAKQCKANADDRRTAWVKLFEEFNINMTYASKIIDEVYSVSPSNITK